MTTTAPISPKPRRRWLQFSLRTVMVLMLVLGCGLGWLAYKIKAAREQRAAVDAIHTLGGGCVLCNYWFDSRGKLMVSPNPPGPLWLRKLVGDDFFVSVLAVELSGCPVTDTELDRLHIRKLNPLYSLSLNDTGVTDVGLARVCGLTGLRELKLANTPVTDAGLVHLKGLPYLFSLTLDGSRVTDAGLVHLKGLPHLFSLTLNGSRVTDAGLVHLTDSTELRILDLSNTRVTDAGVAELQKALPECSISR